MARAGSATSVAATACIPWYVTGIDWVIIGFALLLGAWGYRHGLIVGFFSLVGFLVGAFLGARLGPALLADGAESPYAPATALAGALLIGSFAAVSLEGVALRLRRRILGPRGRRRSIALADAAGGAVLLAAVALAVAWLFGAVALNAPGAKELRQDGAALRDPREPERSASRPPEASSRRSTGSTPRSRSRGRT